MKFKSIIFLMVLLLFAIKGNAQSSEEGGYLKMMVQGLLRPLCRVDTSKMRTSDTVLYLPVGKHRVQIWEPTLTLIDSTVVIKLKDTVKYSFTLGFDPAWVSYAWAHDKYKSKRNKNYFVSPIFIGLTLSAGILMNQVVVEKQYKKAMDSYDIYFRSGYQTDMDKHKDDFEASRKKYNNDRLIEYGIYAVSGALIINYIRIIKKQSKVIEPVYHQDKLLSRIDFDVRPGLMNKGWLCGLRIKI